MAPPDVSKLKLSAYMPAKPKLWFGVVEAKMELAGLVITDKTHQKAMFALVVGELTREIAMTVEHLIEEPTPETAYNDIKGAILDKHQESPTEAHKWILEATLGDQKPSALAEVMRNKLPKCNSTTTTGCPGNAWNFRHLFEAKMPQDVRNGLVAATFNFKDMKAYLRLADDLHAAA